MPIFDNGRNHFYPRPDYPNYSSAAQSDYRTVGDVILPKWYESRPAIRQGGMVLVNLSRGRQPVVVERFHKNRTLASFYLMPGTSCALATQPLRLYMLHICLKNRPQKKFRAGGIPFAQVSSRWG